MRDRQCQLNRRLRYNQYTLDIIKPIKEEIKKVVKMWIRVCGANSNL